MSLLTPTRSSPLSATSCSSLL
uniref:Uncharacterized protein n=1 Tax=Arundo donax TaxID=35708 RepID=A0A0A9H7Q4_ARUDO